jgi:predicted O-methyltransferase YrrM
MAWKGGLERALDRCNAVLRPTGLQIAWYSSADRRAAAALRHQGARLRYRDLQFFRGITAPGHVTIEEARFLAELAQASAPHRPIVEIGTLFGFSTLVLARAKHPGQRLITVDNYCWNPLGLSPEAHARATASVLQDAVKTQNVEVVRADKDDFYRNYDGPPPALFFCDADHEYEPTLCDLRWARDAGADLICGHDYHPARHPGVVRAVTDLGGAREIRGTVFVLAGPGQPEI